MAGILDGIGGTPLVELRRVVPPGSARVVAKLESANPTGRMEDRMARAAIAAAAADGRLQPGGTAVEYTAGTTGSSLALACTAMGFRLKIVTSDAFAAEKLTMMRALGAEVLALPSEGGRIDAALVRRMGATAQEIAAAPGHWLVDQLSNHDATAGYHALGEEMLAQAGRLDALVQSVGTGHALQGAARALRRHLPKLHVAAVEPAESAVLSAARPARPACCQNDARVPGKPACTTASSPEMSTPSSSALVVATPSSSPDIRSASSARRSSGR